MTGQPFRLLHGGRIDRGRRIRFRFDGEVYYGHPGDTLASALLANGVRLVGRSFKYHRPRGIFSSGSEEPNALVELRDGARREPNTRATTVELFEGLEARSQNRFPSLRFDLLAVNQLLAPLFVGGFYYKTFMWPASFWEPVYEKLIRSAAGLGRAAPMADPDRYEHGHLHCDVLVVGAGPAGLMAAREAARSGARTVLVDEQAEFGGAILRERSDIDGQPGAAWLEGVLRELAAAPELRMFRRTTAFGYYDHNVIGAIERVSDHKAIPETGEPRQCLWTIRARQVVLATGAIERAYVFGDNDRPGIMLAGAVRAYVNRYGVAPGRRTVVATCHDDAYRTAFDLQDAGGDIAGIVDARDEPGAIGETARERGIAVWHGSVVSRAHGSRSLQAIEIQGAYKMPVACDLLAISSGWNPVIHLASQSGAKPVWHDTLQAFVPGKPVQSERSAGSARGIMDLDACLADGIMAGRAASGAAGFEDDGLHQKKSPSIGVTTSIVPLFHVEGEGKAFVDLQNDVTVADIRIAEREGYRSVEHVKRYTTLGMATDQGKTSNINGMSILAKARNEEIPEIGTTTFRPPFTPVAIGAFAGHERGMAFKPVRRTALHRWHERNGAVFIETGQWLRAQYYGHGSGDDVMTACAREASAVRRSVGLCDVSTLGKIELFGLDAAKFLDHLYINGFSKLAVGRARYGIMLREDGHVFDDGTISRLGDHHYLITTTTANAAAVLAHMEYCQQCVWPELDVAFCSATEQWCAIAVAGPKAREVVTTVVDGGDVTNGTLPYMGVMCANSGGYPIRLFRISFSGELGYEIHIGWRHGEAMWQRLMDAGRPFNIVPYGTEALAVMRIEKGHVAGNELDGRTTAADLGLERMQSSFKSFIGQAMATRDGMIDPARPRLVGLRPVDKDKQLRGGAHLVKDPLTATAEDSLGWVSSAHWSPHVGSWIALGFVRGGHERRGQTLVATYPLKNEVVEVEIADPCFIDPQGDRLRV